MTVEAEADLMKERAAFMVGRLQGSAEEAIRARGRILGFWLPIGMLVGALLDQVCRWATR